MTSGQITYDRRRLRRHGLIERIPHTHRYQVTDLGLRHALFLTRAHTRLLRTGLAEIHGPPVPTKLRARRHRLRNRNHRTDPNSRTRRMTNRRT
jgi:Mn-dependent DtxR family transcriptional regulator